MTPLSLLLAWLGVNALATRSVWRSRRSLYMVGRWIGAVWIIPFLGAAMAFLEVRKLRRESAVGDFPGPSVPQEPARQEVQGAGVEPFLPGPHLAEVHGFPLMDWDAAARWLAGIDDAQARGLARRDLHRAWLEHLRESLGAGFWIHESDDAAILSSLEPADASAMSRYVATSRKRVAQTLGALARFPAALESVVLVMDGEEAYYRYISIYGSADGEQAFSGGCFIDAGCPHFVVRRNDLHVVEPVIAHELTHSALAHLRLPLWVDEGLAVNTEHRIAGAHRGLHTPRQLHAKHVAFWNDRTIQEFWSGASFRRADDGNLLSYDLARILVAQLGRDWPAFEAFARAARRADAGAASARSNLGIDLATYVGLLCERESGEAWEPKATDMVDEAASRAPPRHSA
jgi:hypothetical protein